jgi:hypothetical protein
MAKTIQLIFLLKVWNFTKLIICNGYKIVTWVGVSGPGLAQVLGPEY